MFSKVLIANRGEIAVRIILTCRELGISTVAVYSTADETALHVRMADTACCIGPAAAVDSYLNGMEIIRVAIQSGAEAIHPGYGFLAENAAFAADVIAAGLTWIGPPPRVISLLGDKVASKHAAEECGVPVVPGYAGTDWSLPHLGEEATRLGYPIMLKAAAGGGGKGMRIVHGAAELPAGLDAARREAWAAFGDDRIFLEKLLIRPRHVEIQILADAAGGVVYLGERDCSLQRRHQKVIEESPAPTVTERLRTAMGEAAVRIARTSGYVNAGTVEFLLDGDQFYFLEVNTRIQVEHPVTEMTTGLDLVRLQLQVAAGERLPFSQLDVVTRGHAIEARIYAEDPDQNFLPSTGILDVFELPQGPGIRNDVGVERGDAISVYYDPMIAKLIVHAETRSLAVTRLQLALERYACAALTSNLAFLRWIAHEPDFVHGDIDIDFIDRAERPSVVSELPAQVLIAAALADTVGAVMIGDPWNGRAGWRVAGMVRRLQYRHKGEMHELTMLSIGKGDWRIRVYEDDIELSPVRARADLVAYRVRDVLTHVTVTALPDGYSLTYGGTTYELHRPLPVDTNRTDNPGSAVKADCTAPMPGTVVSIPVIIGQTVQRGEPLVILEAMKMEHVVEAASAGTVKAIKVQAGDMVASGAVLVQMDA